MPDYTVSGDVDSMLRSANDAAIRSAIGVGTTDAPTFLAQTLTGQSLTGTQATNLIDLNATWNTTGNPSLIYGRVTNTNSGTTANLIDLGTFAGGSLFSVNKQGRTQTGMVGSSVTSSFSGILFSSTIHSHYVSDSIYLDVRASGTTIGGALGTGATLSADAPGILAQRNGTAKQTLRIYNTYTSASIYERAVMDWNGPTPGNLQIGTEFLGSGSGMAARPIDFVVGGVAKLSIATNGNTTVLGSIFCGAVSGFGVLSKSYFTSPSDGLIAFFNLAGTDFNRLQLGGTTDAFPAIARDGAGIKFTGAATGSTSWIKVPAVAVASLPAAATAGVGARSFVNDALAPTFGSAVTGGGAVTVPVYSTGSAWNVG